jgi:hypothetical protein
MQVFLPPFTTNSYLMYIAFFMIFWKWFLRSMCCLVLLIVILFELCTVEQCILRFYFLFLLSILSPLGFTTQLRGVKIIPKKNPKQKNLLSYN